MAIQEKALNLRARFMRALQLPRPAIIPTTTVSIYKTLIINDRVSFVVS